MNYGYNQLRNIDRQIEDLQSIRNNFIQSQRQQPITNIINTQMPQNSGFDARILNENENPSEILINNKTMFFDPFKGKLTIKEINGDFKEYDVVLPKTKEQLQIEELMLKNQELERRLNEYAIYKSNNEKHEPTTNDIEPNEPTTKTTSRNVSKKSE